jgi:ATP-dependent DNA helicase RecG
VAALNDSLDGALGRKTADALAKALDLHTVGDLLRHYPRRYAERGELTDVAGLELSAPCATGAAPFSRCGSPTATAR